jgi:segregation and condensation protein A
MVEKIIPWWRKAIGYAMSGIRSLFGSGRANGGGAREAANREERPEIEGSVKQDSPRIEVVAAEAAEVAESASVPAEAAEEPVGAEAAEIVAEAAEPAAEEEIVVEETREEESSGAEGRIHSVDVMQKVDPVPSSETNSAAAGETPDHFEAATASEPEGLTVVPEAEPEADLPTEQAQETTAEVAAILEAIVEVEAQGVAAHTVLAEAMTAVETSAEADSDLEAGRGKAESLVVEAEAAPAVETVESIAVAVAEPAAAPAAEAAAEPAPTEAEAVAEPAPAAAEAEAALEEAPTVETPQPVAVKSEAEQKTAARVAAAIKAREESADPSPFSIFVGQVYDGPLDLLLDLIRKQDIDIYDIPIAKITAQFLAYVNQLKSGDMDVAGEFIYTASLLIHIKSKMLLPRTALGPEDAAEDPRRELVERLLEHERFKNAAQMLQQKQMLESATWTNPGVREFREDAGAEPEIAADTTDLVRVFQEILERARNRPIINVEEDSVTVGQMIQFLARRLIMEDKPVALRKLLSHTRSERALIAMFLALLELVRLQAILLRQDRHFSEIFVKKHSGFEAAMGQGLAGARDDWR